MTPPIDGFKFFPQSMTNEKGTAIRAFIRIQWAYQYQEVATHYY